MKRMQLLESNVERMNNEVKDPAEEKINELSKEKMVSSKYGKYSRYSRYSSYSMYSKYSR